MGKMTDRELLELLESKIGDKELVADVKSRLDAKSKALSDLESAFHNLEETNRKLVESEKTRSNFLSELRNEINNPMAAIIALTESMLHNKEADVEMYRKMAVILYKEGVILDFHMNNILMAAELEAGEVTPTMSRVDVSAIIKSKLDRFTFLMQDKNLKLEPLKEDPLWVNVDPELLGIVAANLISNGIVYNKDGGSLEIGYEVSGENLMLTVQDSGIGISEDDQKKIFARFAQLDTGLTKRFRGLGLGLSVARAAAEFLGGSITVSSVPGRGSVFTFIAPAKLAESVDNVSMDGTEFFF